MVVNTRIKILLDPMKRVTIPFNYNYYLSSAIYSRLYSKTADLIHNSPRFKFFVFSDLIFSKDRIIDKYGIITDKPIKWFIGSPYIELLRELGENLVANPIIHIGKIKLTVPSITVLKKQKLEDGDNFATISPICVSKPIVKNGKMQPRFLRPDTTEFFDYVKKNLLRKYVYYFGKGPENANFDLEITGPVKERLIQIKNTNVKAYHMHFTFKGNRKLIEFAFDSGLGEKNSMGFGMVVKDESNKRII